MAERAGRGGRTVAAPVATLLAGVLCAGVAGAQLGLRGVLSAALATAVVAVFFWSGTAPLALASLPAASVGLGLLVLLVNYALRLLLALVVLALAVRSGDVDRAATGLTLIACALVWTTAQAVRLARV